MIEERWGWRGALIFSLGSAAASRFSGLRRSEARDALAAAAAIAPLHGNPAYRVVSPKPHLAHHVDLHGEWFPPVATLEDLETFLCRELEKGPALLFFGTAEAARRPSIRHLQSPETAPEWLLPIAHDPSDPSTWTVYDVRCVD